MRIAKILYLDSYTQPSAESNASDEIGYGITTSDAIKSQLRKIGYIVHDMQKFGIKAENKLSWICASYNLVRTLLLDDYDLIFIFHAFHQFPSEIRRIVLERKLYHIKIIGYTHGSHWDKTDTFRSIFYPQMHITDLANLMSMDKIFVVSHYFREVLLQSIAQYSIKAANDIAARLVVTGLPINSDWIDLYKIDQKGEPLLITFNHSPTEGKDPATFFRVMKHILAKYPVSLVVTRKFYPSSPGNDELEFLCRSYPDQVHLCNTLSIPEYYATLWVSSVQVSTAHHESFGISTLEAMYTNNCCILPNRQSYPEITDGLGLYSSEDELIDMLNTYITDSSLRNQIGSLMCEKSIRYLPQSIVQKISDCIQSLLSQ